MVVDIPENRNSVTVPKLGGNEKSDSLNRVVSSIDLREVEPGSRVGRLRFGRRIKRVGVVSIE